MSGRARGYKPPGAVTLEIRPITLRAANAIVAELHRHHKPARGCRWCTSVVDASGAVRAVAIVGRPVARRLDDGVTCEVVRLASDGTPNACSMLYGAVRRQALAMGFARVLTYTLPTESGSSLRGAGWRCDGEAGGGSWSRRGRERSDPNPTCVKVRWVTGPGWP